jgi:large subunit ribosomal protein L21
LTGNQTILYDLVFSGGQMYAIIETGGKQYRVEKGDIIDVELLDVQAGEKVKFSNVLFLNDAGKVKIGNPLIAQSVVQGELISEVKGPKEIAFKYKQRKPFRRKVGHRQRYARVKITEITG